MTCEIVCPVYDVLRKILNTVVFNEEGKMEDLTQKTDMRITKEDLR